MIETNLIEDLRLLSPPGYGQWLLLALVILVVGAAGFWLQRSRKRLAAAATGPAVGTSPWEIALAELERLSPLLEPARSRDYGIASTAVLRRYLEARYELHAPRLTTEEFLLTAGTSERLPPEDRGHLGRFLELCDLFKFGRFIASVEELRQLHTAALNFVLKSRPVEAAAGPEGGR